MNPSEINVKKEKKWNICLIEVHNGYPRPIRTFKMGLNRLLKVFYSIFFIWLYLFFMCCVKLAEAKIGNKKKFILFIRINI